MKKLIIGTIAIILVIVIGVFAWYNGSLKPVSKKAIEENELIRVEIEKGLGTNQIAKVLEKNDVNEEYIFDILDKWAEERKVKMKK